MTITTHIAPRTEECAPGALSYLERPADSKSLVVLLHGLGQDADDYRHYLSAHPDQHSVAITLPGFEPAPTTTMMAVPLDVHARAVSDFLSTVAADNRGKDLILVGFSLGADIILRLAEYWDHSDGPAPRLSAAVLLDPNVNQSTMLISSLFAQADPNDPLPAFKRLIGLAPDRAWLRDLCAYLAKIESKDFVQLWQLSRDMLDYWQPEGYEQIGARLAVLAARAGRVRVVLSASYDEHLPAMRESALAHGVGAISFHLTELRHFDLIGEHLLSRELELIQ